MKNGHHLTGAKVDGECSIDQVLGPVIKYGSKLRFQCYYEYD